jgi:hypothetical protein
MHSMHHLRHADSRKIRLEKRFHEDASIGHMEHEFAVDHMVVVPLTRLNDHGDSWYHNRCKTTCIICRLIVIGSIAHSNHCKRMNSSHAQMIAIKSES